MHVAKLELCKELFKLSGWEYDEENRRIEKVWLESFSTSEMGQGHEDYETTLPTDRRQYHIGEYRVTDNPRNWIGIPEHVPWGWANRYYEETVRRSVPAYDLGYLFGKLPDAGSFDVRYVSPINPLATDLKEWYGRYVAYTPEMRQRDYPIENSPADAACRLAIRLFKQGILPKGEQPHE